MFFNKVGVPTPHTQPPKFCWHSLKAFCNFSTWGTCNYWSDKSIKQCIWDVLCSNDSHKRSYSLYQNYVISSVFQFPVHFSYYLTQKLYTQVQRVSASTASTWQNHSHLATECSKSEYTPPPHLPNLTGCCASCYKVNISFSFQGGHL